MLAREGPSAVVAEGLPMFRDGIVRILTRDFSIPNCHATGDVAEAIESARARKPRLAVIDCELAGRDIRSAVANLVSEAPRTIIVLTASHFDSAEAAQAVRTGACACILKTDSPGDIRRTLGAALAGRAAFSPTVREQLLIRPIYR